DGSNCQWPRRSFRTRYSARQRPGLRRCGPTCSTGMSSTGAGTSLRSSSQSSSPRSCGRPSGHGEVSRDMSMVSSYPSSVSRLTQAALAGALFSSVLWMTAAEAGPSSIELPGERAFPESITSARDGTLFVGRLGEGGVVRADPRTGAAVVFVASGAAGSRSITGVFADDASGTLWACSNDLSALGGPSEGRDRGAVLKAFDLRTGAAKRSVPLPEPHPFCNDI